MGFGKSLFDFVGYMSFFNHIGTGRVSDSLEKQDDFSEDVQDDSSEDESFSSDDFDDL
jgi:hypothetical protein